MKHSRDANDFINQQLKLLFIMAVFLLLSVVVLNLRFNKLKDEIQVVEALQSRVNILEREIGK